MNGAVILAALACKDTRSAWLYTEVDKPYMIAIVLYRSEPNSILFYRTPLQSRPLLVDSKAFDGSYPQTMYIGTMRHYSIVDSVPCVVGKVELFITEKFPYFASIDPTPDNIPGHSEFALGVYRTGLPEYFSWEKSSIITFGVKFDTSDVEIPGNNSVFVLIQYTQEIEDERLAMVFKSFALVSGDDWASLTAFILDEEAVGTCFQTPAHDIMLDAVGDGDTSKRIRCRRVGIDEDGKGNVTYYLDRNGGAFGLEDFNFCLEEVA